MSTISPSPPPTPMDIGNGVLPCSCPAFRFFAVIIISPGSARPTGEPFAELCANTMSILKTSSVGDANQHSLRDFALSHRPLRHRGLSHPGAGRWGLQAQSAACCAKRRREGRSSLLPRDRADVACCHLLRDHADHVAPVRLVEFLDRHVLDVLVQLAETVHYRFLLRSAEVVPREFERLLVLPAFVSPLMAPRIAGILAEPVDIIRLGRRHAPLDLPTLTPTRNHGTKLTQQQVSPRPPIFYTAWAAWSVSRLGGGGLVLVSRRLENKNLQQVFPNGTAVGHHHQAAELRFRYRLTKFSYRVWRIVGAAGQLAAGMAPPCRACGAAAPACSSAPLSPRRRSTKDTALVVVVRFHSFSRLLTMVEDNPVNNVPDNANKKKRRAKRSRKKKDPSKTVCKFYLEGKVSVLDYACLYCTLF